MSWKIKKLTPLLFIFSISLAFECQPFSDRPFRYSTFTQHITSPEFPSPRPPGNYVCEYTLNPKRFLVRILFTDFFLYGSSIQESLMTNCLQGDGDYIEIHIGEEIFGTYCAASNARPPPISATGNKLTVRYVVRSNTTRTTRPGFQASYEFTREPQWLNSPIVISKYILVNGDGHSEMTLIGPGLFDIMLLIQSSHLVYMTFNATSNSSILDAEIDILLYDGSTSMSLTSHRQTNMNAFDFTSRQTTVLVKIKVEVTESRVVRLQFVYAFCTLSKSVGGSCPVNYYPCEGSFHCIPNRLLCDSYSHCPDGSDEIYCNEPCLKCRNGGVCDQHTGACQCVNNFYGSQCHFYACGEANCNQGVCKIADSDGSFKCVCYTGYTGTLCDVKEEGNFDPCPCERKNRCQTYVSSNMGVICNCFDNYYGSNCEFEDKWDRVYVVPTLTRENKKSHPPTSPSYVYTNTRTISKLWIILLTAFGLLFLIVFCCCIAKRGSSRASRSTRESRPRNSTNNQAPPLIRSSSSLFAMITAWRRATMRPQTPPPSYDAIAPMYFQTATDIVTSEPGRMGNQHDATCGTITRDSSGLPDVISDGEMRSHIGQSIVSQV